MEQFAEVTLVVEGALEAEETFTTQDEVDDYLATVEAEAAEGGWHAEVFVLVHDHPDGFECECAQYAQDHRPVLVVN